VGILNVLMKKTFSMSEGVYGTKDIFETDRGSILDGDSFLEK
jgi:hypothetical protein